MVDGEEEWSMSDGGNSGGRKGSNEWGWFGSTREDDYIEETGARFHTGLTNVVFLQRGRGLE
jgi:hypothetical protein